MHLHLLLLMVAARAPGIRSVAVVQPLHGETAVPANELQPRNHNPHPYIAPAAISAGGGDRHHKNHVKRRQSPALFNQGPIQFPTNNNDIATATADNTVAANARPAPALNGPPHNSRRIIGGGGVRGPTAAILSNVADYGDYDQQSVGTYSKKHYAFSYVVRDHASGDDFSHSQQQQQNGAVKGSYKVQLPDGRTQIVKYTADDGGYKADVSYIEDNHIIAPTAPTLPHRSSSVSHHHSSPHLIAAEPIYNYYKHLQETQQQQPQHAAAPYGNNGIYATAAAQHAQLPRKHALNYASLSGGYNIPAQPTSPTVYTTPSSTIYHQQQYQPYPQQQPQHPLLVPSPTPSTLSYAAHAAQQQQQQQYVQNVHIETYNTAPHHKHHQHQLLVEQQQHHHQQQQLPYIVQPTRIVFPTSPTPYQDIHVLPSPRPHPQHVSPASFAAVAQPPPQQQLQQRPVSLKHTSIVSSPASALQGDDINYNYRDYEYLQHPHQQQQQAIFVATEATPQQQQQHALYYKRQAK